MINAMGDGDLLAYEMWLNYDNDAKTFRFPVLPKEINVKEKGNAVTFNIDQLGEIFHKSKRGALRISFDCYFPAKHGSYCNVAKSAFKTPEKCHRWIQNILDANNPAHFVLTGSPFDINCYVLISNYTFSESGGDVGTINYSIELQEYRSTTLRTVRNTRAKNTVDKSENKKRVSNKEKTTTVTIKNGDCLWNLAKKYYGSGSQYTKILAANRAVLDKAARKHGYSSSNNGNLIFAGTVITIP